MIEKEVVIPLMNMLYTNPDGNRLIRFETELNKPKPNGFMLKTSITNYLSNDGLSQDAINKLLEYLYLGSKMDEEMAVSRLRRVMALIKTARAESEAEKKSAQPKPRQPEMPAPFSVNSRSAAYPQYSLTARSGASAMPAKAVNTATNTQAEEERKKALLTKITALWAKKGGRRKKRSTRRAKRTRRSRS